jgi:hypothetical protein
VMLKRDERVVNLPRDLRVVLLVMRAASVV